MRKERQEKGRNKERVKEGINKQTNKQIKRNYDAFHTCIW
jgi:hypothetical protein